MSLSSEHALFVPTVRTVMTEDSDVHDVRHDNFCTFNDIFT